MKIRLDDEINRLRSILFEMGNKVESAIDRSIKALMTNDRVMANQVIFNDNTINKLEIKLDQICLKIFALQQPIACDLRFVASVLKVNNDLERMGDFASLIAEDVIFLITEMDEFKIPYLIELNQQAKLGKKMAKFCLEAFMKRDVQVARELMADDSKIDKLYEQCSNKIAPFVYENPTRFKIALSIVNISKSLERIGDHAVNICEHTVFLDEGKIVKHHNSEQLN